eukprot:27378_4
MNRHHRLRVVRSRRINSILSSPVGRVCCCQSPAGNPTVLKSGNLDSRAVYSEQPRATLATVGYSDASAPRKGISRADQSAGTHTHRELCSSRNKNSHSQAFSSAGTIHHWDRPSQKQSGPNHFLSLRQIPSRYPPLTGQCSELNRTQVCSGPAVSNSKSLPPPNTPTPTLLLCPVNRNCVRIARGCLVLVSHVLPGSGVGSQPRQFRIQAAVVAQHAAIPPLPTPSNYQALFVVLTCLSSFPAEEAAPKGGL